MEFIISQILGGVALLLVAVSYFVKSKTWLLFFHLIANLFYATSFLVLGGAVVGGVVGLISTFRTLCFYILEKRGFKKQQIFLPPIYGLYIGLTIALWSSWLDILPLLNTLTISFALSLKKLNLVKIITFISLIPLLLYSIFVGNWVSCAQLAMEMIVIIISLIIALYKSKTPPSQNNITNKKTD